MIKYLSLSGKQLVPPTTIYGRPQKTVSSSSAVLWSTGNQHFIEKFQHQKTLNEIKGFVFADNVLKVTLEGKQPIDGKCSPGKPSLCPECFEIYHLLFLTNVFQT
ncbi:hypothetical protein AVEN_172047-1 [Araneus ventricosus]|uniref:Uncharacterized protein n=1 Tax=Araneus ventricosus TaxID=182803 RepID=A0A4Y2TXJ5_ARAVE|nr:hypothetical protein AVEN_172047-1 [Araneus ventricosus]